MANEKADKNHFTQLPNILDEDEFGFTPLDIALFFHFKRLFDTNQKPRGVRFLAKKFGASNQSIKKSKEKLIKADLLKIRTFPASTCKPDEVQITDTIWQKNADYFSKKPVSPEQQVEKPVSPEQQGVVVEQQKGSDLFPQNNTLKELNKEKDSSSKTAPAFSLTDSEKKMSDEEFLSHLQKEFPQHDVISVYKKLQEFCRRPEVKIKPTRTQLKKWLLTEETELVISINKKPDWKTEIDNCNLCDEKGLVEINGKFTPCEHSQWKNAVNNCELCNENGKVKIDDHWKDCEHKKLSGDEQIKAAIAKKYGGGKTENDSDRE